MDNNSQITGISSLLLPLHNTIEALGQLLLQKTFEYTKEVFRSHKSRDRQEKKDNQLRNFKQQNKIFFTSTIHLQNNLPQYMKDSPSKIQIKDLIQQSSKTSSMFFAWLTSGKYSTHTFKAKVYCTIWSITFLWNFCIVNTSF